MQTPARVQTLRHPQTDLLYVQLWNNIWAVSIIKESKEKKPKTKAEHHIKQQAFLFFPSFFSVNSGKHNFFLGNNNMVSFRSKKQKNK